ncbi:MAG: Rieske 2Fe-2S domain-containing protein [Cyanobacteria bacterium M_surface_7_m2_040]|nr:Rieske 2Fe-2S domain-containing protein [Cyanobacteria bacterium M_surface_9_m1_291]MBM5826737.1 Rieske 2Fe-2S domain-containing protein [Cyanobacteria bacterium M_surface_7_m2_040]
MSANTCRYRPGLRHWHPLLASRALRRKPIARTLAGERLVLFRTASGQAAALAETCPHRRMSLAAGRVQGDELVCAYHGWRFAPGGAIRCPLMPASELRHQAFQVREAHGLIWIRQATQSEDPPLPSWDSGGLALAGVAFHTVPAPLELTLDNFTEVEHTSSIHQVFGFTQPEAIEHRLELEPAATRVWNSGPQKAFPPVFNGFIDNRPGDSFANDWITTFDPLLTIYDQTWRSPKGKPRRFRLKVVMFFVPIDDTTTQLTTLVYSPKVLPGRLHRALAAPIIKAVTAHELNLDVWALAQLADLDTELNPRTLGPLDRVLLENRRRLKPAYLERV